MLRDRVVRRSSRCRRLCFVLAAVALATAPPLAHAQSVSGSPAESAPGKAGEDTGGLGISFSAERGLIKVLGSIDNSPGAKADIRPGDVVTHVDGEPVHGLSLKQVVEKIRGPAGTNVRLTIEHAGGDAPTELVLAREIVASPDDREQARLYRLGAEQGIAAGQTGLANFYATGRGGLPKDDREAARLFKLAADQGSAPAQVNLGSFYAVGRGGLRKDERESARLYKLAADQGNANGQVGLANFYMKGSGGLAEDEREAARLFKLAVDQGQASAQNMLADFYATGRGGLPKNDKEAARLWKLGADQNYAAAQRNLGSFYAQGRGGLPKDMHEAGRLWKLAAAQGDSYARSYLTRLGLK
jgi:TPR repeat protein